MVVIHGACAPQKYQAGRRGDRLVTDLTNASGSSRTRGSTLYRWDGPVVTPPGAALPGFCVLRSASMKMNWSGGAAEINGVP